MTTVIEGDVVTETCVILPPSKEEKLRSLSQLSPEQQVDEVTTMLVQSNAGLLVAIAAQDLPGICEAKAKAATIAEIAKQLRMGKDMQLNAAEFVRRAERGLGVELRGGQERGEVETEAEMRARRAVEAVASREKKAGRSTNYESVDRKPSESDYLTGNERHGSGATKGGSVFDMVDGVSDDQFEEALAEARDEGNLSRANVARKAKAKAEATQPIVDITDEHRAAFEKFAAENTSPFSVTVLTRIAKAAFSVEKSDSVVRLARRLYVELPAGKVSISAAFKKIQAADANADEPAPETKDEPTQANKKRVTKHTSTEMLVNIDGMLQGIVESIQFITPAEIDAAENVATVRSIRNSVGSIRKLLKELENG